MCAKLTDFESDLLRLCIIWGRVMTIFKEYPNHMKAGMHELFVRHLLREVTVEQLHNFIKIRNDLLQNSEFKKLDDRRDIRSHDVRYRLIHRPSPPSPQPRLREYIRPDHRFFILRRAKHGGPGECGGSRLHPVFNGCSRKQQLCIKHL